MFDRIVAHLFPAAHQVVALLELLDQPRDFGRLVLEIQLPEAFPEKHREGVVRAADLCAVKKHILNPPVFEIRTI